MIDIGLNNLKRIINNEKKFEIIDFSIFPNNIYSQVGSKRVKAPPTTAKSEVSQKLQKMGT